MFKNLLKVFFDFVILIRLDVHIMPVCSRSLLHLSKNPVFDKMETVPCVYTGVCIHCFVMSNDWKKTPIYLLLPINLLNLPRYPWS